MFGFQTSRPYCKACQIGLPNMHGKMYGKMDKRAAFSSVSGSRTDSSGLIVQDVRCRRAPRKRTGVTRAADQTGSVVQRTVSALKIGEKRNCRRRGVLAFNGSNVSNGAQ